MNTTSKAKVARELSASSARPDADRSFCCGLDLIFIPTTLATAARWCCPQSGARVSLLVVARGLLLFVEIREIVLDPELRAGLLDESLYRSAARERLVVVELKRRGFIGVALFLIMIQVSGQHDRPGFSQLYIYHLMPRRVPVGCFDDHRAVAEDVIVLASQDFGLAVL